MAGYLGATPVPQATQHRESFTATAGQTTFATAGYTVGFLDVYLNGVHLTPADVTATNGSDVVLGACLVNDIVDVISHSAFELNAQTFTGTTTMTDVVAASLDISGNIDIDGTTNLDATNVVGTLAVTGSATISSSSGDTLTLTKDTTEPSLRIEGDSNKDFVFTVSGELLTLTQNDGTTDIVTFDHDTKVTEFKGTTSAPANASVSVSRVASQGSLGTASNGSDGVVLQLNQETTDDSGAWNSSNYRFTALRAGRYLFSWSHAANINNGAVYRSYLWKNGSQLTDTQLRNDSTGAAASYLWASRSKILKLAADDYIELRASTDSSDIFFADSHLRISLDICLAE